MTQGKVKKKNRRLAAYWFTGLLLVLLGGGIYFLGTFGWRACREEPYPKLGLADTAAAKYFSPSYRVARQSFLDAAGGNVGLGPGFGDTRYGFRLLG